MDRDGCTLSNAVFLILSMKNPQQGHLSPFRPEALLGALYLAATDSPWDC